MGFYIAYFNVGLLCTLFCVFYVCIGVCVCVFILDTRDVLSCWRNKR